MLALRHACARAATARVTKAEEGASPGAPLASACLVGAVTGFFRLSRPDPELPIAEGIHILVCGSPAPRPCCASRKNPSAGARFCAPRLRRETLGIEEEKRRC